MASINVKKCPIYFLTGEYDWSTTPEMSQATAKKIPGANFKAMKNLGHFPATEDPNKFVSFSSFFPNFFLGPFSSHD